jgi:hypothetical protein
MKESSLVRLGRFKTCSAEKSTGGDIADAFATLTVPT